MSDERHILVTNDDGIEAPGLWKLAEAMAEFGRVMIVVRISTEPKMKMPPIPTSKRIL